MKKRDIDPYLVQPLLQVFKSQRERSNKESPQSLSKKTTSWIELGKAIQLKQEG
jgi:hypothetical protein